jgi:DNA-binding NarL/FixJ family response regulator
MNRPLTKRELQTAQLVADGLCYKQIAESLNLSYSTVMQYGHGVMIKTGTCSIGHACCVLLRKGIIK